MKYDLGKRLDELTDSFFKTFGYQREHFPQFDGRSEEISIEEYIQAMESLCLPWEFGVEEGSLSLNQGLHINRVCSAIEEGSFPHSLSRTTEIIFQRYKRQRWRDESRMYGFRLRWQIRLNRAIPGKNLRIPALDEIANHDVLRFFSALRCLQTRIVHAYRYKSLETFYYMDRRYGPPILVTGKDFSLSELFFPQKSFEEVEGANYHALESVK